MRTSLRLVLVTFTVGGGFCLISLSYEGLRSDVTWSSPAILALVGAIFAASIFVTASGLLFVIDPRCVRPMQFALALQIPWFSSPWFAYKMVYGFSLIGFFGAISPKGNIPGVLITQYLGFQPELGAFFDVTFRANRPFGIGINLIAVMLIGMLRYSVRKTLSSAMPETEPAALRSFGATVDRRDYGR